jgi:hypothetical protein
MARVQESFLWKTDEKKIIIVLQTPSKGFVA